MYAAMSFRRTVSIRDALPVVTAMSIFLIIPGDGLDISSWVLQAPTACQRNDGDVPNGMPPYCGNPSGATNCRA